MESSNTLPLYHSNARVNATIEKGKNGTIKIEDMITDLENMLGSRGAWPTLAVVGKHVHEDQTTFEEMITEYLELPLLVMPSESNRLETNDYYNKIVEQKEAYSNPQLETVDKTSVLQLTRYIKTDIFRYVIFLTDSKEAFFEANFVRSPDDDSDEKQNVTICNALLQNLGKGEYSITQKVHWWLTYRQFIHKSFPKLRGQITRSMFCQFVYHYNKWNEDNDSNEYFEDLMNLCDDHAVSKIGEQLLSKTVDKNLYRLFISIAFSGYYCKNEFKKAMKVRLLSDVITVPEEAFGILTLENNYNRWKRMATLGKEESKKNSSKLPDLLYQKGVKVQDGKKPSAGTWTDKGYERMNALINLVELHRSSRESFEKDIRKMFRVNIDQTELEEDWINTVSSKKKNKKRGVSVVNCMRFRDEKRSK